MEYLVDYYNFTYISPIFTSWYYWFYPTEINEKNKVTQQNKSKCDKILENMEKQNIKLNLIIDTKVGNIN